MNEFALLFRQSNQLANMPEEEMKALIKKWQDWIGSIAAQGKLANNLVIRLVPDGKVLKSGGVITDGPFVEIRERLGGLIVIKADTIDEATTLAHGCPVLDVGGSVEVRAIMNMP